MPFFAVTTLEKMDRIPPQMWINVGVGFLVLILSIALVRGTLRTMNKYVLAALFCVVFTVTSFTWVYERNEPRFLKPFVDTIAPYFPGKITGHW